MRLLMIEARVVLADQGRAPVAVAWEARGGPPTERLAAPSPHGRPPLPGRPLSPTRKVVSVVDRWRYDGRWWEVVELHRDYYLLELEGGMQLELFSEGDTWWAARASD